MNEGRKNDRIDGKVRMELPTWPELEEAARVYTADADWRINSVWHSSDEEPEERKEILVEYRFMTPDGEIEVRREVVESLDDLNDSYCDVLNWAYIDDLTPERKEKQYERDNNGRIIYFQRYEYYQEPIIEGDVI